MALWPKSCLRTFVMLSASGLLACTEHAEKQSQSVDFAQDIAPVGSAVSEHEQAVSANAIVIRDAQSQERTKPQLRESTLTFQAETHGEERAHEPTSLSPWLWVLPKCDEGSKPCRLDVERRFYPDGPNTLLTVSHAGHAIEPSTAPLFDGYSWTLVESWQQKIRVGNWRFSFQQGQLHVEENDGKKSNKAAHQTVNANQTVRVKNCNITPLWLEDFTQSNLNKDDSNAKQKVESTPQESGEDGSVAITSPVSKLSNPINYSDDQPKQRVQFLIECGN